MSTQKWSMHRGLSRGFNSAVFWSFLSTGLRLGGAVLILPIVVRHLPAEQLGLWYVLQSIASVVLLLDAGFGITAVRSMSYAWSGVKDLLPHGLEVKENETGGPTGPNYPLLADLVTTMNWYFRGMAVVVVLGLLGPGSLWLWHRTAGLADAASLHGAWVFFSLGMAVNVAAAMWSGVLPGINAMRLSEQIFTAALVANYAMVAMGLLAGWGLWALVAGQFLQGVVIRFGGRLGFFRLAGFPDGAQHGRPTWALLHTLWPMSWRMALMGLGSSLIIYANTMICSTVLGLAETASYGLTFQLVMAVAGVSAIWVNVKLPLMNQLRASGDTPALARMFIQRLRLSLATYLVGALALLLFGPWFVGIIGSKTPLLPLAQTATLLLTMILNMQQSLHVSLVLSENRNPFVMPSLLTGIGITAASLLLTPHLGMWGMLISLGLVQLSFMNWWTMLQGFKSLRIRPLIFFRRLALGREMV